MLRNDTERGNVGTRDGGDAPGQVRCALAGEGALARAIGAALAADGIETGELSASHTVLIVATDCWDAGHAGPARRDAVRLAVPMLPVHTELGRAVVGPLERAGTPGCGHCVTLRRSRARPVPDVREAVLLKYGDVVAERASLWLTTLAGDSAAAIVAGEIRRLATGQRALTEHAVLYVDLADLTVSRHRFLPDPLCPRCGALPADSRELAQVRLMPRLKPAPGTYRVRPVLEQLDELRDTYVDAETGLISAVTRDVRGGLVVAAALMRLRSASDRIEPGIGRSHSYRTSETIGLLEALERYGGVEPGGKRTVARGSYRELGGQALDPRTLGVHPAESYGEADFPYRPFHEDAVCNWVWGYSFARREPVLVPETAAYYHTHRHRPEDRPFFYEISNGCALGSCLEEAILYGILEVAERDAFLLTWYGQLPVPRVDLATATGHAIPLQSAAITAETGFEPLIFDTTMEHGVPSVWAVAVSGDARDTGPRLVCAAGAHLDLECAVLNALSEVGPIVHDLVLRYPGQADRARHMAADPRQVTTMGDHSLLYAAPEAAQRLDFLLRSPRVQPLSGDARQPSRSRDLTDDLRAVLERFLAAGIDVIVVDQTTPEHRAGGFSCVKVLAAGAVPMTFGFRNRRTEGIPRLYRVPHLLGYRPRPLRHEELNPHPHPFP